MPFKRCVETGRVALVSDGPHKGKLISIVDVIDQTRVLVDGPQTNVPRGALRLNQLHLTKFRLKFPYTGSTRVVRKAWIAAKIDEKWKESMWAKKLANKKKRLAMSDFDRFKLRKARQIRNKVRTQTYYRIKARASRDGTLYGKKNISKVKVKPRPANLGKKKSKTAAAAATAPPTAKAAAPQPAKAAAAQPAKAAAAQPAKAPAKAPTAKPAPKK